jgi:hypothetical protein
MPWYDGPTDWPEDELVEVEEGGWS